MGLVWLQALPFNTQRRGVFVAVPIGPLSQRLNKWSNGLAFVNRIASPHTHTEHGQ